MSGPRPWTIGDLEARWNGYLIAPDSPVPRNLVHATAVEALSAAEDDLLEFRLAEHRDLRGRRRDDRHDEVLDRIRATLN